MFSELSDFSLFPKKFCDSQALCKLYPSTSKATQTAVNFPFKFASRNILQFYCSFLQVSCKKGSQYIL